MKPQPPLGFSTRAIHAGEESPHQHRPITIPIYQTATFSFQDTQELWDYYAGTSGRIAEYGRYGNPTTAALQQKLCALEGAEMCELFPSGMNALTTAILHLCKAGDELIMTDDNYRGSRKFIERYIGKYQIDFRFCETTIQCIKAAVTAKTRLIITEIPTNPCLRVLAINELATFCRQKGIFLLVDATFATPYNLRPLEYGVDIVLHSATKYLGGHNDLIAGALLGRREIMEPLKQFHGLLGGCIDPNTSYLLLRSLKTFALRMKHTNESALAIARFLQNHPKIEKVYYPLLETHEDFPTAQRLLTGGGGIVTFLVKGDLEEATRCVDALKIATIAPSLGGAESLAHVVSAMTYHDMSREERQAAGIKDNMIRYAVGLEDVQDLIDDLQQALSQV